MHLKDLANMFTKMLESGRGDGCYEVLALVRQLLAEPAEKVLMCGIDDPRGVGTYDCASF